MKLNEQDKKMFKNMAATHVGTNFDEYLERVIDEIHNSRSWPEDEDANDMQNAANLAETMIKRHIKNYLTADFKEDITEGEQKAKNNPYVT